MTRSSPTPTTSPKRFEAYGWHVEQLGEIGDDCDALEAALDDARADDLRPTLLVLRSHIATPSPDHTDDPAAHANPFKAEDVTRTKSVMGIPDEPFWAPDDLVETYRTAVGERGRETRVRWEEALDALDSDEQAAWDAAWQGTGTKGWEDALPVFEAGEKIATRQAMAKVLAACLPHFPGLVSGAADLTGNTGVKLPDDAGQQTADNPGGRQVFYGIREHGMGAACVGMAMHGGVLPLSGTFFVFLDYMRPPVRLATISWAKAVFVFSHDSVGVGEDGPTHQPVEQLATLRAIPGLQVIRPADANETAAAWRAAVDHDGPTVLVLTRQGVRGVHRRLGGRAGCRRSSVTPTVTRRSSSSPPAAEVAVAIDAAEQLAEDGTAVRVVSLPSWDRFAAQDTRVPRVGAPTGCARAVRRGRHHVRMGALCRRLDRHRPLRRQRSRRRGAAPSRYQRRARRGARPPRSSDWRSSRWND